MECRKLVQRRETRSLHSRGRRTAVCRWWKVNFEEYLSLTDVLSVEQVELDDSRLKSSTHISEVVKKLHSHVEGSGCWWAVLPDTVSVTWRSGPVPVAWMTRVVGLKDVLQI